jgi:DNA-binding XRE family transcriptional regulator
MSYAVTLATCRQVLYITFMTGTWGTWRKMRARCEYPAAHNYRWYGGRGVKVCKRWRSFQNFLEDMGERPDGLTIHRLDNDGDYKPGNCKWATRAEQVADRGNVLTQPRADTMNFELVLGTAIQKAPLPALARDLRAVAHKLRYPLADILAKVPGETLAERARKIGVSRQTMYVWAQERFRPSTQQAAIIAKLTGIPVEQIGEYQEGKDETHDNGARKPARKKVTLLAKAGRKLSGGAARLRAKRGGVVAQQGKRGHARTGHSRTAKRPVSGESD